MPECSLCPSRCYLLWGEKVHQSWLCWLCLHPLHLPLLTASLFDWHIIPVDTLITSIILSWSLLDWEPFHFFDLLWSISALSLCVLIYSCFFHEESYFHFIYVSMFIRSPLLLPPAFFFLIDSTGYGAKHSVFFIWYALFLSRVTGALRSSFFFFFFFHLSNWFWFVQIKMYLSSKNVYVRVKLAEVIESVGPGFRS